MRKLKDLKEFDIFAKLNETTKGFVSLKFQVKLKDGSWHTCKLAVGVEGRDNIELKNQISYSLYDLRYLWKMTKENGFIEYIDPYRKFELAFPIELKDMNNEMIIDEL